MCCLVCKGKKKEGKPLTRKSDGMVLVHGKTKLKQHLERHGIVFGGAKEEAQVPTAAAGQTRITHFTRMSPREQEEITQAIVLMCALDNRPFAIVEGRGFRYLLEKITGKRYNIPSRSTLTRKCTSMADQARGHTRTTIKVDAAAGATFTLSFDAWKDKYVDYWLVG